jgi:hypothetical protein
MTAPVLSRSHGRFTATWDGDEPIEMEFGFVRASRREGEVTAEVKVASKLPGYSGILHRARITLGSTRSQAEFAKHLDGRTKGSEIDWTGKVATACILVLDAHREGDPAILIREALPPPDAGFILPPFLLGHHPTILFGDGGAMKSTIGLAAIVSLHGYLPAMELEPTQRVRCGYLDWEFEAYEHNQRMRALLGPDADLPDVPYLRMVGPLSESIERVERFIADHNLEYLVCDSVGLACDGPPEESQAALGYYGALRQLAVGSLTIAHTNRVQDDSRPFGSVYHHNSARMTWFIKKQAEAGQSTVDVGLWNKKSNTTALQRPLGFRFQFSGDRISISRTDVRDVDAFADKVAIKDRIVRLLESGAKTRAEIYAALPDLPQESIAAKIRANKDKVFAVMPSVDGKGERIGLIAHSRPDNEKEESWPTDTTSRIERES